MNIINTKRNRVIIDSPEPDDVFVRVSIKGQAPGQDLLNPRVATPWHMPMRPIAEYQDQVDWAVSVADQFARPLYVVPISAKRFLTTEMFEPYRKLIADLSNAEWGELRQLCIATCAEVMRDCDDPALRADCYDILVQLKVIHHAA